jgi:hypothetical protein
MKQCKVFGWMAALTIALAACGGGGKSEPTGFDRKVDKVYASIDTTKIITEADVVAQYKVYWDLKNKNREVLQNEPLAAIEDLGMFAFFMSKKSSLMDLESEAYKKMAAAMDSLDKANGQK